MKPHQLNNLKTLSANSLFEIICPNIEPTPKVVREFAEQLEVINISVKAALKVNKPKDARRVFEFDSEAGTMKSKIVGTVCEIVKELQHVVEGFVLPDLESDQYTKAIKLLLSQATVDYQFFVDHNTIPFCLVYKMQPYYFVNNFKFQKLAHVYRGCFKTFAKEIKDYHTQSIEEAFSEKIEENLEGIVSQFGPDEIKKWIKEASDEKLESLKRMMEKTNFKVKEKKIQEFD